MRNCFLAALLLSVVAMWFIRRFSARATKCLAAVLILTLTALTQAADFTGVVAFGDSLSDMGNRWLNPSKPTVKFRQTWVAQLAGPAMLNFTGFKPSGTSNFYGGGNYAVGGAGTEATAAMSMARNRGHDLTCQVSQRYLNPAFNTAGVQPGALHVIVIGANDIMQASANPEQLFSEWSTLDQIGIAVARSTEGQIEALAAAGVKHLMWGNVFDIAQAPSVVKRAHAFPTLAPAYLGAVTKAVRAHNAEMDAAIVRLAKAHPALRVIKLDLFGKFAEVAATPEKFGFTNVTSGANDDKHLFSSDGLHPTSRGHKMLAEFAFAVLSAKPAARTAQTPMTTSMRP